ncbi:MULTISPECIES: hypothetical protein [Mycobacterium]|uniref:hypothetical protein n=1 Tax=Mycobacterium TaxID=1763 RepID=UPI0035574205
MSVRLAFDDEFVGGVGIFRLLGRCIGQMSYREVSVIEIVEMPRLWLQGLGLREVARLSGSDRKTVRRYVIGRGRAGWTATAVMISSLMSWLRR